MELNIGMPGVGVTKPIFSVRLFSHFFPNDENSGYMTDIKFIFGRFHHSWAVETLGKYQHDWKYLTYTFAKPKFPVTDKLTNGALVAPSLIFHLMYRVSICQSRQLVLKL